MKQELQGKLVEILTSIQTAAGKASDFAIEQLPDIAQSYVAYGRASSVIGALLGLIFIGAAVWVARQIVKANKAAKPYEEPIGLNVFAAAAVAVGLSGVTLLAASLQSALLVWLAPKVWLLKEIAGMLK